MSVLHRGFKDLSSRKNWDAPGIFELSSIIFKISMIEKQCRMINSVIYFLDTLCSFRFYASGCFSSIWIGECLKDERWMLLCCLNDGSSWWLCNMFMGKRFIFDALRLRLLFFFWRMIRYSLIWGMKNMKNFRKICWLNLFAKSKSMHLILIKKKFNLLLLKIP